MKNLVRHIFFHLIIDSIEHKNDDCVMLLTESRIKRYTHMLLCGVAYMHQNSIMHRDLKPANLLIRLEK